MTQVDIFILSYNGFPHLEQAIESAFAQTFSQKRIILSDDCSTDQGVALAREKFASRGLVIEVRDPPTGNCYPHANLCISESQDLGAPFIAFFHQDDLYDPEIIKKQIDFFEKNPEVDVVLTSAVAIDERGCTLWPMRIPDGIEHPVLDSTQVVREIYRKGSSFLFLPSALYRRSVFEKLGVFRADRRIAGDLEFWMRLFASGSKIGYINAPLLKYRFSQEQGSGSYERSRLERSEFFQVLDDYVNRPEIAKILSKDDLNAYDALKALDELHVGLNRLSQLGERAVLFKALDRLGSSDLKNFRKELGGVDRLKIRLAAALRPVFGTSFGPAAARWVLHQTDLRTGFLVRHAVPIKRKKNLIWARHGVLNTLEHAITRISDAATSLILLWALSPEHFSKLALAQAAVAPLLFLFVSPEMVLYRDFGKWKAQGVSCLAQRVHALRRFCWGKAQAGLFLSLVLGYFYPGAGGFTERASALIWAFSLVLAPQISGADREFLRIELRLKALNFLSLFQKLTLLLGTIAVALCGCRLPWLAVVAAFSAIATALLARGFSSRAFKMLGASEAALRGKGGPSTASVIRESLEGFSIWVHLSGVCTNWVQTMDLFFLGIFSFPARVAGLYAASLKISNFANALPVALSNLFSVWIGRRTESKEGKTAERGRLSKLSVYLFMATAAQAVVLALVAPVLINALSHGRWSADERAQMSVWLDWILTGNVIISSTYLLGAWLTIRADIRKFFAQVVLPWSLVSAAMYACAAHRWGPTGVAQANVWISVVYVAVLGIFFGKGIKAIR
jgi:glycosyltransferase involved in cell wall biosynthesis